MFFTYKYTIFVKTLLLKVFCNLLVMKIGRKVADLRKDKGMSREELGKQVGTSGLVIGRYERNENTPSIDMILKLAKVFNVSLDYLVGEGQLANYDKEVLKRIEDIEQLDKETQIKLFFLIDNVVQNFKTKQAFAK